MHETLRTHRSTLQPFSILPCCILKTQSTLSILPCCILKKQIMAAYAALVSVMHIIDNLQHHSRPPITLHDEQVHLLTQKITFLQEFLQVYNPTLPYREKADPLECRIARAAYAVEDVIESHISDQISNVGEKTSTGGLYEALEKVIEDMVSVEIEAMEIKKETGGFQNQLHAKSTTPADSLRSTSSASIAQKKSMMVGADEMLDEMKSNLTAKACDLQTIPIVGMGGSGKTTLALSIYHDDLIKDHFQIRAWVTISQDCKILEILKQLVTDLIQKPNQDLSANELGEMLHKHLFHKKYMIILDDMWSLKAWDEVQMFLPKKKKGSRIVITTRETSLAKALSNSNSLDMKLLDENHSWNLLSKTVFGEKGCCPSGFEEVGKKIGRGCKGLPLSIVVVGRILAKSQTIEFWENMEENLNAMVNLEDNERCLKTLHMSYKYLPVHLKPCFLYLGIYREDEEILISKLIRLWVAQGFVKPISGKRQEDVARAYLKDLIDRNLVLIHKRGSIGSIKECKVHDLFRDLCIREAQKKGLYTASIGQEVKYRVSRIVMSGQSIDNLHQLVNSRFFTFTGRDTEFLSLIWQFWNLHGFVASQLRHEGFTAPNDIWYMSHIRHLYFNNLCLPDSPNVHDGIVLENVQTLVTIRDFKCSKQMVKRIPNVRKLKIVYREVVDDERFCLTNLDCLDKLESLSCNFKQLMCRMNFPQSLKKLSLRVHISQRWQDILDKIGALPFLEKLQLHGGTFKGHWETTKGRFQSLKFLSLHWCHDLQFWTSEASHFPDLGQLHLYRLSKLEEIPLDFEYLSTLQLIAIHKCCDSAVESANVILAKQKENYGETTLQIQVELSPNNDPALESFRSPNFHITRLPY